MLPSARGGHRASLMDVAPPDLNALAPTAVPRPVPLAIDRAPRRVTVAGRPGRRQPGDHAQRHPEAPAQARRRRQEPEIHPQRARPRLSHARAGRRVTAAPATEGQAAQRGRATDRKPSTVSGLGTAAAADCLSPASRGGVSSLIAFGLRFPWAPTGRQAHTDGRPGDIDARTEIRPASVCTGQSSLTVCGRDQADRGSAGLAVLRRLS